MKQEQIEALINDMTIEEKLAQMTQLSPLFFGAEDDVDPQVLWRNSAFPMKTSAISAAL